MLYKQSPCHDTTSMTFLPRKPYIHAREYDSSPEWPAQSTIDKVFSPSQEDPVFDLNSIFIVQVNQRRPLLAGVWGVNTNLNRLSASFASPKIVGCEGEILSNESDPGKPLQPKSFPRAHNGEPSSKRMRCLRRLRVLEEFAVIELLPSLRC